jgi:hypothetical protein
MATAGMTRSESHLADWFKHGLIGGIVAGVVFATFEMVMAAILDGPDAFFMPLRMIGGIAIGQQALDPGTSLLSAGAAGLVVHMVLSAVYGIGVAGVAHYVPALSRSATTLIVWASAAGLGLWLVNFYVIAPIGGWTWFPEGTNPLLQFVAHTFFYGTVLGLYLNIAARRA